MNNRIYILFFLLISTMAVGQNGLNSPFSRFGIGDLNDQGFVHLRQMGNTSASFADAYHINVTNPASYSYLQATSFEVALETRFSSYASGNDRNSTTGGQLSYMALAFPLKNPINNLFEREKTDVALGMSFYLLPVSTVAYDIVLESSDEVAGDYETEFLGSGGTYKVGWGNSIKYKGLSFGANLGMIFGNIESQRNVNFLTRRNAYNNRFQTDYSIRGFDYNLGFIYQHVFDKANVMAGKATKVQAINIGLTAKSSTGFNTTEETFLRSELPQQNFTLIDTIEFATQSLSGGILPSEYSVGVTYLNGAKFAIGVHYGISNWSEYVNPSVPSESLKNTKRYSVGGYYRPNPASITSLFSRVYYRFGAYYKEDPRIVGTQELNTYGVSLGLGFPLAFQRKVSHLNLGFDYGSRGNADILRENFFKISLGFTFNDDEWFIKRKFN